MMPEPLGGTLTAPIRGDDHADYLPEVREQYEQFPYPLRNPDDERRRLRFSYPDFLPLVNQACFRGRRDFRSGVRVLVAGSGTGDVEVFMGEQLHGWDAEIIALDISEASLAVAQARAALRGLENIRWVHGSLLDVERLGLGRFDYISCTGVLHHLRDPVAGLRALRSVLNDDGAMMLMVYGRHGREGVYQMQELMRYLNRGETDRQRRVDRTSAILRHLPDTNWFARSRHIFDDDLVYGDVGVYDLFLHSQDRAYTVEELHEFLRDGGLQFLDFSWGRHHYQPEHWFPDPHVRDVIAARPRVVRQAIGELLTGSLGCHFVYCAPDADRRASIDDEALIPYLFMDHTGPGIAATLRQEGQVVTRAGTGMTATLKGGEELATLFVHIDGTATVGQVLDAAVAECPGLSRAAAHDMLRSAWETLHLSDQLLLRHPDTPLYRSPAELETRAFG